MNICTDTSQLALTAVTAGQTFNLNDRHVYYLRSYAGMGLTGIRRLSQKIPGQLGVTDLGYAVDPRFINLSWIFLGTTLDHYYDIRNQVEYIFQPRFNDPIQLTFRIPGPRVRALDVDLDGELDFPPGDRGWADQLFSVILKASDPRLYDPTQRSVNFTLTGTDLDGLEVPWPVPFTIGASDLEGTAVINYASGDLSADVEFPVITITGPITDPIITNNTTQESLGFNGLALGAGDTVTIDLNGGIRRDSKTIRDQDGNSLDHLLTLDSDLATFHLAPAGELLPDQTFSTGDNSIGVLGENVTTATAVAIAYYDRYKGL